jgi:hypothetical protein
MTGYESPDYGSPKPAGPDHLLMFLVFGFIILLLLRAFVSFG